MTVYKNNEAYDASNVWFEDGSIKLYSKTEKPPQMKHIDYGLGVFRRDAFANYPRDAVVDLAAIQTELCRRGELAGCEMTERFYEIGSPAGLAELNGLLRKRSADKDKPK
jgi:NDP-sugar pyrophosphorylase family protein